MSIIMILSTMYDDVCILHVWHLFLPILSPSQLVEDITRSRAPAAEAVPELQPRIFTKHFPPACTLHKDPQQVHVNFHKTPLPPFPAPQQLMPALPGRCGTWREGEKIHPTNIPCKPVAPTGVFHQLSPRSLPFAQLINIQD